MSTTQPAIRERLWRVDGEDGLAAYLGTSRDLTYRLIASGELRSIRVGRFVRVPDSAVEEFIENGGSQ